MNRYIRQREGNTNGYWINEEMLIIGKLQNKNRERTLTDIQSQCYNGHQPSPSTMYSKPRQNTWHKCLSNVRRQTVQDSDSWGREDARKGPLISPVFCLEELSRLRYRVVGPKQTLLPRTSTLETQFAEAAGVYQVDYWSRAAQKRSFRKLHGGTPKSLV